MIYGEQPYGWDEPETCPQHPGEVIFTCDYCHREYCPECEDYADEHPHVKFDDRCCAHTDCQNRAIEFWRNALRREHEQLTRST